MRKGKAEKVIRRRNQGTRKAQINILSVILIEFVNFRMVSKQNVMGTERSTSSAIATAVNNVTHQMSQLSVQVPLINDALSIKLDRGNYLTWRDQMQSLISAYGLEDFINGVMIEPSRFVAGTQTVNSEYTNWSCINGTLKSGIFASVSQAMLVHIVGKTTARDQWISLEKMFASTSRARVMELKLQL